MRSEHGKYVDFENGINLVNGKKMTTKRFLNQFHRLAAHTGKKLSLFLN